MIAPLQLLAGLLIIAGVFALLFEIKYFADFSLEIYLGRLVATLIGFIVLFLTYFEFGKKHPVFLIHTLLVTIILSFTSIILKVPESIFINSQLLSLLIFTSALFLSWDIKNQIIVAIYYNLLFAISILLNNETIYFLPNFFAAFIFVIFVSLLSVMAAALNYRLRSEAVEKSIEAQNYLENAIEGIFKISVNGNFLSANPAIANILKFSSKEKLIENITFEELFSDKKDYKNFMSEVLDKNRVYDFEVSFKDYFKEETFVILNARAILNNQDEIVSIEGSLFDITERVLAQEKIKEYNLELEKLNKSKDKFFSIVAHDLMSPFTSLLGYSEILHNESEDLSKEEVKEFSGDIHNVAAKAHNLLENLLSWSSIQTNRTHFYPNKFIVYPIVEDVLQLSKGNADQKGITLQNNIPNNFSMVADINMVNAVFRNLVANSVKFTNSGGTISVGISENEYFNEFYVEDTGIGISDIDKEKLFKIDVHHSEIGTNSEKGTGLGLILCAEFVEKHLGTIYVESKIGKGSKFIFTISKNFEGA
ncbi:MAG: PAS domain-containing sensor histidine kinase [Melioribacteraceae bacterium]|nr:PAS domain-containing sensor histidine kinase [Melioribacteraceae bacterium]